MFTLLELKAMQDKFGGTPEQDLFRGLIDSHIEASARIEAMAIYLDVYADENVPARVGAKILREGAGMK